MMSTKHIVLAKGSRLLRELLHHAIEKEGHLQVVQEISDWESLPVALERFDPEWVILTQPYSSQSDDRIESWMKEYPAVGFVFLSPHQNNVKLRWRASCEEEYFDLSLGEFFHLLQQGMQHT